MISRNRINRGLYAVILMAVQWSFAQNTTLFSLLKPEDTGVQFENTIVDKVKHNILLYANYYGGAGVGVGDFNGDDLTDIYFAGNLVEDKLYLNRGDFKFEEVTLAAGIINDGSWSTGVTVADVNNDGHLDIYVTCELYDHQPELRKNKLYINRGDGRFTERAEAYGVANTERTRHATFLDYNKDGYLDLFVLNQPPNPGSYSEYFGTKLLQPKYTSRLYKNVNGTAFEDVTESAGLFRAGFPNAVSASDLNHDGWTDLYVANDFYAPDVIYMNNKDGTFTNVANSALNHMPYYSMGVDVSDINNDGFLDIFVVDMVAEDNFRLKSNMSGMKPSLFWKVVKNGGHYQYMFNNLHLNNGNGTFSDIAQLANVAATDWSWANLIADFDNDGLKDIYITNGLLRDIRNTDASQAVSDYVMQTATDWTTKNPNGGEVSIWDILDLDKTLDLLPSQPLSNFMYKNTGDLIFTKVASDWGLDQKSFSNGAAYADFDNDGDLDIVVNNINEEAFIYRNNTDQNYLRVNLKSKANKPVFGTRVMLESNNASQMVETTNVRGIYSTSEQTVHFGLGKAGTVPSLTIQWPNGKETRLSNIKANKVLELFMEDGKSFVDGEAEKQVPLFEDIGSEGTLVYQHQENNFDDYEAQILLPHKMSQFGPALATDDVNNDGLDDVYIGAAAGYPSKLFIQSPDGSFRSTRQDVLRNDRLAEDVDAVFFDVDGDADKDLYVVSGGNAHLAGHDLYSDRLYLNDGTGMFSRADLKMPAFSGSVAIPFDFDKDGDLDLFVGGRHIPQDYPMPADSKLLENQNGKLVDVTKDKAPELFGVGMVADAISSDYDNDGDQDLLLLGDWMPVTVFENTKGHFSKHILPDLSHTTGWWFSIEQGDFDNDGDMDYVLGNLGLNYKYKALPEAPFDVYYDDFDDNGSKDIVLGYYNFGKHYPLRGFSCSAQQVPDLKSKVKSYDLFASLEIQEVYGQQLEEALYYKAETFATSYMENLGNGRFNITNLPVEAQVSNVNDMLVDDFNKDGNPDILMVGNLFVSEIETTRNDGGIGAILLGDGKNNFEAIHNSKSGFFANNDARKVKFLGTQNHKLVLVANNDYWLQIFKMNR
ncbi:VCBS repeat-containing protein [Seonamhaeicola sp.]|uniref:VCBS repeat-containing protein n=1 Tax=Seonamhaeicola sp. TaxID=1912245 RepID=UPI0026285F60|nr:VCBS repeat-containing protein [Seonamhaeicola sp.]